jgi:hypothetical protein
MPQLEPSNSDTWVCFTPAGRLSPSTEKPWFIEVISTLPVVMSLTGWLAPWWPWCILRRRGAERQRQHLVAEADAEHRLAGVDQLADLGHRVAAGRRRVAGAVRQEDAVGLHGQYVFGRGARRHHRHPAALAGEAAQDVALQAVVDGHHVAARRSRAGRSPRPWSRSSRPSRSAGRR